MATRTFSTLRRFHELPKDTLTSTTSSTLAGKRSVMRPSYCRYLGLQRRMTHSKSLATEEKGHGDVGKRTSAAVPLTTPSGSPSPTTSSSSSSSSLLSSSPTLLSLSDLPSLKCGRMTNLFQPYLTSLPSRGSAEEDDSKNNRLLIDNGFVFPSQQGMFHFLPLGIRVLNKLKRVIVEELENVGCQVCDRKLARLLR